MRRFWSLCVFGAFVFNGCGIATPLVKSQVRLRRLRVGESEYQVQHLLGQPTRVRASQWLDDGSAFRLVEYDLYSRRDLWSNAVLCPLTGMSCWMPFFTYPVSYY